MVNRIAIAIALALTLLLLGAPKSPRADSGRVSELMFLTLAISDSGISLVEWNTVPGTLKRGRLDEISKPVIYEAKTAAGITLWSGGAEDPRIIRVESYVLDSAAGIKPHLVRREIAQFTIRVPYNPDIDRIEFSRLSTDDKDGQLAASRVPISTIVWPKTRKGSDR